MGAVSVATGPSSGECRFNWRIVATDRARTPVLCNARLRLSPWDQAKAGSLNMLPYQIAFRTFSMALLPSVFESVSAEECLTTHQQLLEKKVSDRWKELHQKDNQPLSLTAVTDHKYGARQWATICWQEAGWKHLDQWCHEHLFIAW